MAADLRTLVAAQCPTGGCDMPSPEPMPKEPPQHLVKHFRRSASEGDSISADQGGEAFAAGRASELRSASFDSIANTPASAPVQSVTFDSIANTPASAPEKHEPAGSCRKPSDTPPAAGPPRAMSSRKRLSRAPQHSGKAERGEESLGSQRRKWWSPPQNSRPVEVENGAPRANPNWSNTNKTGNYSVGFCVQNPAEGISRHSIATEDSAPGTISPACDARGSGCGGEERSKDSESASHTPRDDPSPLAENFLSSAIDESVLLRPALQPREKRLHVPCFQFDIGSEVESGAVRRQPAAAGAIKGADQTAQGDAVGPAGGTAGVDIASSDRAEQGVGAEDGRADDGYASEVFSA